MEIVEEGLYEANNSGKLITIEVYEHPDKGLCVWCEDYGLSGIDSPTSTDGDGHVHVHHSGLQFIKKLG